MSRYHSDFLFSAGIDERMFGEIHRYMAGEGYTFREFEGEMVYKKGNGFATGPSFVKLMNNGSYVTVEAWIKFAVLPGVYAGEMGLDGFAGAIPKSMLKTRVETIEEILRHWGGSMAFSGDIEQGVPQPGAVPPPSAPPSQGTDASFCASCGAALSPSAAFCESCGAPVGKKRSCCPSCGNDVQPGQSFCARCGTKLV